MQKRAVALPEGFGLGGESGAAPSLVRQRGWGVQAPPWLPLPYKLCQLPAAPACRGCSSGAEDPILIRGGGFSPSRSCLGNGRGRVRFLQVGTALVHGGVCSLPRGCARSQSHFCAACLGSLIFSQLNHSLELISCVPKLATLFSLAAGNELGRITPARAAASEPSQGCRC